MSQILKANQRQERIAILHPVQFSYSLKYEDGQPTKMILCDEKECIVNCLNCANPKCMKFSPSDIQCLSFREMSHEIKNTVCPVDAISVGKRSASINNSKCIGCGLCVRRCPVGAIHISNGKAVLNSGNSFPIFTVELDATPQNQKKQIDFLKNMIPINDSGCMQKENDIIMENVYRNLRRLTQEQQNILIRNTLINLGCQAALSRQGVVYSRMDGFYENNGQMGVLEIETGSDMLAVSRAILDDIAVVNSRYGITPQSNHPLAVVLSLPNKRTDYWQVVKDIRAVTNLKIATLTFGAMLLFLWNAIDVSGFDQFYIDVDKSSIRKAVETELNRNICISDGLLGILENSK
ncbi:MAG: 4Fe-4S binding protein [Christensenellaceae bacterium]